MEADRIDLVTSDLWAYWTEELETVNLLALELIDDCLSIDND